MGNTQCGSHGNPEKYCVSFSDSLSPQALARMPPPPGVGLQASLPFPADCSDSQVIIEDHGGECVSNNDYSILAKETMDPPSFVT